MNKYKTWYKLITERGQTRLLDSYTESHHILPRSLNGTDNKDNITQLTAREHFICHWLLTKIYSTGDAHWKMLNAIRIMRAENINQTRYKTKITARVYAKLKEEYAALQSIKGSGPGNSMFGRKQTAEARRKISEANTGRIQPPEENAKQIAAQTGRKRSPFTNEWKAKMSTSASGENNSRFGVVVSEETRKKIGARIRGTKQSPETIAKKADAIRGMKREKKECPHCKTLVAVNVYPRWHGENCKHA